MKKLRTEMLKVFSSKKWYDNRIFELRKEKALLSIQIALGRNSITIDDYDFIKKCIDNFSNKEK